MIKIWARWWTTRRGQRRNVLHMLSSLS